MATLREYFFRELDGFGVHQDLTVTDSTGQSVEIVEWVNFDSQAGVNFVSYLFPEGTFGPGIAVSILKDPTQGLERVKQNVKAWLSHPVSDLEGIAAEEQPFSGRIFFYVDSYFDPTERAELLDFAASVGVALKILDRSHADFLAEHETPWAFISHDSADKEDLARPLAETLSRMLCPVWYDEYSLHVGQSLRESIDIGIQTAKKCILVLSPSFLSNTGWTKAEFNAVTGKHINAGGGVILPIWHNVSREDVYLYSPIVADIYRPGVSGIHIK